MENVKPRIAACDVERHRPHRRLSARLSGSYAGMGGHRVGKALKVRLELSRPVIRKLPLRRGFVWRVTDWIW